MRAEFVYTLDNFCADLSMRVSAVSRRFLWNLEANHRFCPGSHQFMKPNGEGDCEFKPWPLQLPLIFK